MDGLEAIEISNKELNNDFRIDSEYFYKNDLLKINLLNHKEHLLVYNFSTVTDGIHTSIDYDVSSGINLISATSPKFNFFDLSRKAYISKKAHEDNKRTALKKNDVIISTVGTIGNCAVVDDTILPANSDRHVGIIRVHREFSPYYLSTFLLSKYGRCQTERETTGNVQPNLFLYKIREIIVPLMSKNFQDKIEHCIKMANNFINISQEIINQVKKDIFNFVSINNIQSENWAIKSLSNSFKNSGRLDAEYYQHKYEELESNIKANKFKYLKELAEVQSGEFVEERNYGDIGYSYIRGTDITNNIINFEDATKVNIKIEKYKTIDKNDIAFAMIGSVGNVAINKREKCVVSNNLGSIKPFNKTLGNYLLMVLSSPIGQLLFEKYQTRTAQPKIRTEDVENFVIPLLDNTVINVINQKTEDSFKLREQSKKLLDTAVKAVEMAIETDENTAIQWLKTQN